MHRLLLLNHHETALELTFPWARGPRQPNTQCRIPFNGVLDTSIVFPGLPKGQVKAIIEASPDYIHWRKRCGVELLDLDGAAPERKAQVAVRLPNGLRILPEPADKLPPMPPVGDPSPPSDHPDTPPLPAEPHTTREDAARRRAEEKAATEAFQQAQERARNAPGIQAGQPGQPGQASTAFAESGEPTADAALEPGMKETAADSIPSTRWSIERLATYATERGIDIAGLSKNAALRKIRGA